MSQSILRPEEHERLAEAIRLAEARTSGEIYCVVARSSDGYFHVSAFFLTLWIAALALPAALLMHALWLSVPLPLFAAAQLLTHAAGLFLLWRLPSLRIHLVPRRVGYLRAHVNAVRQFLAHNIHATGERTGLLIFVSLAERYAEVVADAGIDARVEQAVWNALVADLVAEAGRDRLADGLAAAISAAGATLAAHFPPTPGAANELPDRVVEI